MPTDVERLSETSLKVLADPAEHRHLGRAARKTIEERYSLETCIPKLKSLFERVEGRDPRHKTAGLTC